MAALCQWAGGGLGASSCVIVRQVRGAELCEAQCVSTEAAAGAEASGSSNACASDSSLWRACSVECRGVWLHMAA